MKQKRKLRYGMAACIGAVLMGQLVFPAETAFAQAAGKATGSATPAAPATAESDAWTKKARELYNDGTKAYKQSKWAEAHALFSAAWSLKNHWQIAANLADCEIRLGKFQEAAQHAQYYAREAPADKKAAAEAFLKQAQANVATLLVRVNRSDADVLLDGEKVGSSPMADPLFLMPGMHVLSARMAGLVVAEEKKIDAAAGSSHEVALELKEPPRKIEPQTVSNEVAPTPTKKRSMVPAYVLGGVSLASIGIGIGLELGGQSKAAHTRELILQIKQDGGQCAAEPKHGSCGEYESAQTGASALGWSAVGFFIVGGLSAGAAITYLLWPSKAEKTTTTKHALQASPWISPTNQGMAVRGTF